MHSPPVEWTLGIGYLGLLDYLRSRGDADGDTLSEVIRAAVDATPYGRTLLALGLIGGAGGFFFHIVNPLKEQS